MKTLFINCFCILLFAGNAFAQRVVINLDPKGISPKETEYQILEVLDHRIQKAAIGEVFNQTAQNHPYRLMVIWNKLPLDFTGKSPIQKTLHS